MTVPNLDFLRYPHLYTFSRAAHRPAPLPPGRCGQARRVITVSTPAREELSQRLRIDPAKIEVMMPLAARMPQEPPLQAELEHTRRKYGLPEMFILMIGTVEPHHNHEAVLDALALLDSRVGGGRLRPPHGLFGFFAQLCPRAAFGHARGFHLRADPRGPSGVVPHGAGLRLPARRLLRGVDRAVVEALRAELPMVLSDTRLNREAAGHAAAYVNPEVPGEVVAALENALCDESWRQTMRRRERAARELFSEYAVAERLMQIYTSL